MTLQRPTGGQLGRAAVLTGLIGVLLVLFGPGSMTPDSIDMCQQAVRDLFNDWHAPIVTGAWGLVDVGITWIFLGQLVVTVTAVHLILAAWLRPWIAVAGTWVVLLFPATLGWMGHVGKDEWFAAATLAAIALLGRAGRAHSVRTRWLLVGGVLACWSAVAARPNGIVPIAALLVVMLPVTLWPDRHPALRVVVRVAVAGLVAVGILVSTTLWERLVVDPAPGYPMQVTYLYDLTGMSLRTGEVLLPDVALERPTSVEELAAVFDPGATNEFYFGEASPVRFGPGVYDADEIAELGAAWRDAVVAHPGAYLATRWTYARLVTGWSAPQPATSVNDPGVVRLANGTVCPIPQRWVPEVHEAALDTLDEFAERNLWRGWWFAVLLAAAAAVAGLVRVAEARGLAAAGLVSLASVVLAGGTTTFRYSWFTALCAVVATVLALRRVRWCAATPSPDALATATATGDPVEPEEPAQSVEPSGDRSAGADAGG